jgi:hypothetical protein
LRTGETTYNIGFPAAGARLSHLKPTPKEKLPGHAAFRQFNNGLLSQGKPADLASTVSLAVGRQRPVENFRG